MHNQTNDLFSIIANISANKYTLEFNPPALSSKDKKLKHLICYPQHKYELVQPFTPTIYQMRKSYEKCSKEEHKQEIDKEFKQENKESKKELFDVEKEICMNLINPTDKDLSKIYRLMGFKILNIFALYILKKTHPARKVERIVERVTIKYFIIRKY